MADTALVVDANSSFDTIGGPRFSCSTAPEVAYAVYIDAPAADFEYTKLSGGLWGAGVSIRVGTVEHMGMYYDKWTRNVTTNRILLFCLESVDDDLLFNSLDVSNDVLDGEVIAFDAVTVKTTSGYQNTSISCVRAEGGNIYVFARVNTGLVEVFRRSTDGGATWTARATVGLIEDPLDRIMLVPGNEVDTDDIYALFYDDSAGELTLKTYDNSADSWSESSAILTGLQTVTPQTDWMFSATQRHSDGHILVALATDRDVATADLKIVDITNGTTWTVKTDVITDTDDWAYPAIFINQQNDDLFVAYVGQDDGAQALQATVDIHYVKSTDGGDIWGAETTYSVDVSDDYRSISSMTSVGDDGGNFMPVWFNDDLNDLFVNLDNDVNIAASGVAGAWVYQRDRPPEPAALGFGVG